MLNTSEKGLTWRSSAPFFPTAGRAGSHVSQQNGDTSPTGNRGGSESLRTWFYHPRSFPKPLQTETTGYWEVFWQKLKCCTPPLLDM